MAFHACTGRRIPILILDEPTTVLTDSERETLFSTLRGSKQNASVILISHRLQEIVDNSDRIVILRRRAERSRNMPSAEAKISEIERAHGRPCYFRGPLLGVRQGRARSRRSSSTSGDLGRKGQFEPMSFSVRKGEIVSLVGLVGSGKEAICRCITGQEKPDTGRMEILGRRLPGGSPGTAVRAGHRAISPSTGATRASPCTMSVAENVNLLVLKRLSFLGFMSPRKEKQNAERWVEECLIKTPSIGTMCGNLSGGNQQKTVLAKWLSSQVRLLVLDHPTRGVDVGAKAEIYRLMRRLAGEGIAMLIMCDTLEEDIGLSDRMLVMKDGRLVRHLECRPDSRPTPQDIISLIV